TSTGDVTWYIGTLISTDNTDINLKASTVIIDKLQVADTGSQLKINGVVDLNIKEASVANGTTLTLNPSTADTSKKSKVSIRNLKTDAGSGTSNIYIGTDSTGAAQTDNVVINGADIKNANVVVNAKNDLIVENSVFKDSTVTIGSTATPDVDVLNLTFDNCNSVKVIAEDVRANNLTIKECTVTEISALGHGNGDGGLTLGKVELDYNPSTPSVGVFTASAGYVDAADPGNNRTADVIINGDIKANNTVVTLNATGSIIDSSQNYIIETKEGGSIVLKADDEIIVGDLTSAEAIAIEPYSNASSNALTKVKTGKLKAEGIIAVETTPAGGTFESGSIEAGAIDLSTDKVKINGNVFTDNLLAETMINGKDGVTITGNVHAKNSLIIAADQAPVEIGGNVTVDYTVSADYPPTSKNLEALHIYNTGKNVNAGDDSSVHIGGNINVNVTIDQSIAGNYDITAVLLGANITTSDKSSKVTVDGNIITNGKVVVEADELINISGKIDTAGADKTAVGDVLINADNGIISVHDINTNGKVSVTSGKDNVVLAEITTGIITAGDDVTITAKSGVVDNKGIETAGDINVSGDELIFENNVRSTAGDVTVEAKNGGVMAYESIISDLKNLTVKASDDVDVYGTLSADEKMIIESGNGTFVERLELAAETEITSGDMIYVNAIDSQYADKVSMTAQDSIFLYHGIKGKEIDLTSDTGTVYVRGTLEVSEASSNGGSNTGNIVVKAAEDINILGNVIAVNDVILQGKNVSATNVEGRNTVEVQSQNKVDLNNIIGAKGVEIYGKEVYTANVDAPDGTIKIHGPNSASDPAQTVFVNGYMKAGAKDVNDDSVVITTNGNCTVSGKIDALGNVKINSLSVDENGNTAASDITVADNITSKTGSITITDALGQINTMSLTASEDVTLTVTDTSEVSRISTENITAKNINADLYGIFTSKNITGEQLTLNVDGNQADEFSGLAIVMGDINITPVTGFSGDAIAIDAKSFEAAGNINVLAANNPAKADIRINNPGTDASVIAFMDINNESGDVHLYAAGYVYGNNVTAKGETVLIGDTGVETWNLTSGEGTTVESKYGLVDLGTVTAGGDVNITSELKNIITNNISAGGNAVLKGYSGVQVDNVLGENGLAIKAKDITIETKAKASDFKPYVKPLDCDSFDAWLDKHYDDYLEAVVWTTKSPANLAMAQKACDDLNKWMQNGMILADKPVLDPALPAFFHMYAALGTVVNEYNADVKLGGDAAASGNVNITSADAIRADKSITASGPTSTMTLTAEDDIIVMSSLGCSGSVTAKSADGKIYVHDGLVAFDNLDVQAKNDIMLNYVLFAEKTSITSDAGKVGIAKGYSFNADSISITAPEGITISDNEGPLNLAAVDTSKGKGDIEINTDDVINDLGAGSKDVTDKFNDLTAAQDNLKNVLGTITSAEYQEMEALEKDIKDAQAVLADPNATAAEKADAQTKLNNASNTYNTKYGAFVTALNKAIKEVNDAVEALNKAIDNNNATITSGGKLTITKIDPQVQKPAAAYDIGYAAKPLFVKAAGAETFEAKNGNVYVISKGNMILDHVEGGNVALYTVGSANAPASILVNPDRTETTPVVKGGNVSLIAINGDIGNKLNPMTVDPGKTLTTHGNDVYGSNTKGLAMHEHVLGYGFVQTEPTCENIGSYHGFCPVCAAEYDEVLDALGHIWDSKFVWSADHTACD
ncbi:MAG: hypothetical protein HUJ75_03155, partial [Parasporobacterium sp.]|nr:hypothetical protein [Parasporobacterium sp.]